MTVLVCGFRVAATVHAAERARTRVPQLEGVSRDRASVWVEHQVGEALAAGRKALNCPRWCTREWETGWRRRSKAGREGTMRFVWDEQEEVAFLVRRTRDRRNETLTVWLVVTVLAPQEGELVA